MMEEWFSKMQPPIAEQAAHLRDPTSASASPSASAALNLSTKSTKDAVTAAKGMSRTTQVYLKPITTPPKLSSPVSASSGSSSLATQKYNLTKKLAVGSSSPVEPPVPRLSPPQLEVRNVAQNRFHPKHHQPRQQELVIRDEGGDEGAVGRPSASRQIGRAAPFGGQMQQKDVRSRALRDVEMALTRDIHGNFPIHMSVLLRKPDLVHRYSCVLQVLESSVDLVNDDKMTPLHLALRENDLEIIEILLAFGADPAVKDRRGNNAFHMAAVTGDAEVMRAIARGARKRSDINDFGNGGLTPLHVATLNGDTAIAQVLAQSGADATIPDAVQGLTPLAMMKQAKLESIIAAASAPKTLKGNVADGSCGGRGRVGIPMR